MHIIPVILRLPFAFDS
uniref:Uncharacterized protein n=2 Tax=Lepeophtheirus salmonis TaxID=72036 RepID=A0A0K2VB76_LEPSM